MRRIFLAAFTLLAAAACSKPAVETIGEAEKAIPAEPTVDELRLYVLDCGRIDISDLSVFDRGGAYDGRSDNFVDSCYLVRHPSGDLMWDSGLPDALNAAPEGVVNPPFTITVPKTVQGQLERMGVPPDYVEYFSISHSHFDHVGNANLFKNSTFIVNEKERDYMFRAEARADTQNFANYSDLEAAKKITFTDSYDVFGDGSVIIISMPGHTPGHSVLLVNLEHTGPVLLSGDLYHLDEAREKRTVPAFNTNAEDTIASMDKFEELAKASGARVIIQHEDADFNNLPRAPAYLD
ncbi:MAG: N-acyl homoserine lactonase family protein [Parvularculaceae bacterium]|nr:N-acyl homoserine lactonase family protein [Parvularculaceae bacterium]